MGRRPRTLLAGGIYHVYNRVFRGEHTFRSFSRHLSGVTDTFRRTAVGASAGILAPSGVKNSQEGKLGRAITTPNNLRYITPSIFDGCILSA